MAEDDAPEKLKREKAGTYRTSDGRFAVEQSSSGWVLVDDEQTNELGLPLTRGPFATLDEVRDAIAAARSGTAPRGEVVSIADRPRKATGTTDAGKPRDRRSRPRDIGEAGAEGHEAAEGQSRSRAATSKTKARPQRPPKPAVVIRELRAADGEQLRRLWAECGFRSLGDDDLSLARMARRNPGLLLVASEGTRVVASALGAWDGRRGWIYHVATATSHRRQGLAARLLDQVEAGLRDLGCPKVSVLVREANEDGREFWRHRGYDEASRQFARELQQS